MKQLFLLDPTVTFLNHGSFGACPRTVFEAYQSYQAELEHQPVLFLSREFAGRMDKARAKLAGFLGSSPEDLIFVPNATHGGNIVANAFPLEPGDEVLGTDLEYGAMERMWEARCARAGAHYRTASVPIPVTSHEETEELIWSQVTDKTKLLFLSHITSSSALTLPIEGLIRRAREAGIVTFIDGAHAPGQIDLNLDELGADFYTANCHKWLMAPKGAAFLFARKEVQDLAKPLVISWGNKSSVDSMFVRENEYQGTLDISSYLAVVDAIDFFEKHDWRTVRERCQGLVRQTREVFMRHTGQPQICPDNGTWFHQMVAHPIPGDGEKLKARLYDEFRVEIPISQCKGQWLIRVSVQGYNDQQDIDRLDEALAAVLA